jgi:hypothetical protein
MAAITQASFTPAATSHVAGDVNGGAQEFKSAGFVGQAAAIWSCSLRIDNASIETSTWRLHLFDVTPPGAIADDGAFTLAAGDRASYLGYIDIPQVITFGASNYIESNNIWKLVRLRSSSLFAYLVNGTTLTPNASAHVVTLGLSSAD